MKKIFTLTAALAFGLSAFADDFNLYYDFADQTANKIESVSNLQKLVFEDGNLIVVFRDGTSASLPTESITRLYFNTETVVGIDSAEEETATKKGEVYDLTGRKLSVDPGSKKLPKGIYIVDGQKVIVK